MVLTMPGLSPKPMQSWPHLIRCLQWFRTKCVRGDRYGSTLLLVQAEKSGAAGGTRTHNPARDADSKSAAYTDSATGARCASQAAGQASQFMARRLFSPNKKAPTTVGFTRRKRDDYAESG